VNPFSVTSLTAFDRNSSGYDLVPGVLDIEKSPFWNYLGKSLSVKIGAGYSISWHPAFVQAIQLELEDYLDVLTFEMEHQLTTEPLKIDVLIIKKTKDVVIKKNIGQIF